MTDNLEIFQKQYPRLYDDGWVSRLAVFYFLQVYKQITSVVRTQAVDKNIQV